MRRFRCGIHKQSSSSELRSTRLRVVRSQCDMQQSARYQDLDRVPTAGCGLTPHLLCEAAADTHHHASLGSLRPLHAVSPLASTTEVLMPIHPEQPSTGGLGFWRARCQCRYCSTRRWRGAPSARRSGFRYTIRDSQTRSSSACAVRIHRTEAAPAFCPTPPNLDSSQP
ncbi:hypothetical protein B0H14DRAFT_367418 [Mycena olivaceomarginata]|nr:hypothetical protein B0H14DRAFT_367418 [Mycena olivaceomarginata]